MPLTSSVNGYDQTHVTLNSSLRNWNRLKWISETFWPLRVTVIHTYVHQDVTHEAVAVSRAVVENLAHHGMVEVVGWRVCYGVDHKHLVPQHVGVWWVNVPVDRILHLGAKLTGGGEPIIISWNDLDMHTKNNKQPTNTDKLLRDVEWTELFYLKISPNLLFRWLQEV